MSLNDQPTPQRPLRAILSPYFGPTANTARLWPASLTLTPAGVTGSPPTATITKASGISGISIVSGGSGYAVNDKVTFAGGTFAAAATGTVAAVSSGAITGIAVNIPGVYSAQPTNPVSQASTTGSGTGATFNLTFNGGVASSIAGATTIAGNSSSIRFTGLGPSNNGGFWGNTSGNGTACTWEWVTDAPQFDIVIGGSNTLAVLYVNGQRIDTNGISTDASGAQYIYTINNGGVQTPRTYKLFNVNSALAKIYIPSSSKLWAPTAQGRQPLAYGLGDSYMYGTGATTVADAVFDYMCQFLGLDALPDGIGGTGWNTASPNDPTDRVTTKLGGLTHKPDYVFLDLGYNDAGGNMTTLATSFNSTVAAIRSLVPTAKIIAFGPATPLGATTNLSTVKAAVSAQCAALGIPFIDVENWVDSTNKGVYTGGDNTHPTPAGHAYLGARKAQAVLPYL